MQQPLCNNHQLMQQPPTIAPRWGTWFLKWLDSEDPFDAFEIWRDEMYSDYEWFQDYCESDDYDICEIIDWYYRWYQRNPVYRFIFIVRYPTTIFFYLEHHLFLLRATFVLIGFKLKSIGNQLVGGF